MRFFQGWWNKLLFNKWRALANFEPLLDPIWCAVRRWPRSFRQIIVCFFSVSFRNARMSITSVFFFLLYLAVASTDMNTIKKDFRYISYQGEIYNKRVRSLNLRWKRSYQVNGFVCVDCNYLLFDSCANTCKNALFLLHNLWRCLQFIIVPDLQLSFDKFHQSGVTSYAQMLFDVARNQVFVGAR